MVESWGGKENGFGFVECCRDLYMMKYLFSVIILYFEFYVDFGVEVKIEKRIISNILYYIYIE